ncbi:lytic murein transglycosylase [Asticcacaulis sp. ZE23SCel15]|uniref:lytic murein transglycosylase n=1 Tax=Asticcacaulis sp. ZE23SCel15 TaxID=3059027 RepID=UPI00265FAA5F|nr:lytic murein transglycosylase [Asticcacaulis sp. ZE23SCel15]WKL57106.1 lytic murein transglycosylase [Asticcacaulis sp. ZE23SCel15]
MVGRYLTLALFLTACSSATSIPTPIDPPSPTPAKPDPLVTAPATSSPSPTVGKVDYPSFYHWRDDFINRAVAKGYDRAFVTEALSTTAPSERVVALDTKQPEFSKPISAYVKGAVTAPRFEAARARLAATPHVPEIEATYGVPAALLGGIWTMESDLGRIQGDFDVINAYATLAFDGRRRAWAETQLLMALDILKTGKVDRATLKGSWAGAMGQTQFLPENYVKLGVDADKDGKVDIWTSDPDALGSAANLLNKAGWKAGQAWAVEVILPAGFDYYLSETESQTPEWWAAKGVVRSDGGAWTDGEKLENATLILPSGATGPAFLALPNHFVIRKYNNSTAYALAVGLLGDGIAGKPALKTPWPEEQPLSTSQRVNTQKALLKEGFDPGIADGVIGVGTRKALREWQRANSRPADGYLSATLADELSAKVTGYTILGPTSTPTQ